MFYTNLANFVSAVVEKPFRFIPGRKENYFLSGPALHTCMGMDIAFNFASLFIEYVS